MNFDELFLQEKKIIYNDNCINDIKEFYNLYCQRPINDNHGGMKSPHLFNTWYVLKQKKPKMVIESGVWKGLGTWIIEKALPECRIISIDINYSNLIYKSEKVIYLNKDLKSNDWKQIFHEFGVKPSETLVFLDDHQDFLDRLEFIYNLGIKDIIYEDNYPTSRGDCVSPKKIISCQDYIIEKNGNKILNRYSYELLDKFYNFVKHYQELPPIFKTKNTRWGDEWNDANYTTPPAILNRQYQEKYPIFFEEANSYTWICYIYLG